MIIINEKKQNHLVGTRIGNSEAANDNFHKIGQFNERVCSELKTVCYSVNVEIFYFIFILMNILLVKTGRIFCTHYNIYFSIAKACCRSLIECCEDWKSSYVTNT